MDEPLHYRSEQDLDSKETEKLLEDACNDEPQNRITQLPRADTGEASGDNLTEDSLANSPKSDSPFPSARERQRSDSGSRIISLLRKFYSWEEKVDKVTPFAVILLIVLLLIYVLNQADRLVLPVVIPNGLRCNVGKEDCATQNSTNSSRGASTNSSEGDCIQFNDNQQGLLTGQYPHCQ